MTKQFFFSVTLSYIDDAWNLLFQRVAVKTFDCKPTGENIAECVKSVLNEISFKEVVCVTRDGAASIKKACSDYLKYER